ncbi:MAG: glutamate racemase [Acidobacteriota bacterium]
MSDPRAIGIFDSGIGGLTVLLALRQQLPHESFVYLGDTARLPYGTKSPATVARYALKAANFLVGNEIKMLVVACNTVSATALPALERAVAVPVVGVVAPGARSALRRTGGRIGVIGTESTIASGAYPRALRELRPDVVTFEQACPLFVPLAEEGWFDHQVTREIADIYLAPLVGAGIDTLILGCTHYPLLREAIVAAVGNKVALVDSASAVAEEVARLLGESGLGSAGAGETRLLITDAAARVVRIAALILKPDPPQLELVDLAD